MGGEGLLQRLRKVLVLLVLLLVLLLLLLGYRHRWLVLGTLCC